MQNSFKFIVALLICSLFAYLGISEVEANGQDELASWGIVQKLDTAKVIHSVHEINGIVKTEMYLDSTSFGVCDTCVSSFSSVLTENRMLVDSVVKENIILNEHLEKTRMLNDSLSSIEIRIDKEIKRGCKIIEIIKHILKCK